MDVTTLKQQAARHEREGDLANAIATYREILDQLEDSRAIKRELPLLAKLGDLLSRTGDAAGATAMYEQAAEHYMEHGSAKSISVLCLKVLRADHSQTDVYFRFAQGLFDHGHVEAARAVLVDYAGRAKLAKTLMRLEDLASRPEQEVRHHLEQLFAKVEKRARPPSPTPAPPTAPSVAHEPQEMEEDLEEEEMEEGPEEASAEGEELEDEEVEEEAEAEGDDTERAELEAAPSLVTSDITLPAGGEPDVVRAEPASGAEGEAAEEAAVAEISPDVEPLMSESDPEPVERAPEPKRIEAEPEPEPVAVAEPETVDVASRVAGGTAPWRGPAAGPPTPAEPHDEPVTASVPGRARDVFSGLDYRAEKSRPGWLWPAVAAVAVVATVGGVAMLLTGNGPQPEGGDAGTVQQSPPTSAAAGTELGDTPSIDTLGVPIAAVDSVPGDAAIADTAPPPTGDTAPGADDQPIRPSTDLGTQVVAPPVAAAGDTGAPQPPRIITTPVRADRVLVVEGLLVESVEDLPSATGGYRVVQVLASGEGLAMTVVPIDRAGPIVGGGALRVSPLRGDSAIGTIRFGDNLVTARAALSPGVLEGLLRQLVEIERP